MNPSPDASFAAALEAQLARHPFVSGLQVYPEIGSTNEEALRRARAGAAHGTLIIADRQTAGRGRHGRRWESPGGVGLWFSLVLRPRLRLDRAFGATAAAAVALADIVHEFTGVEAAVRWPNDVLVGSRKVAGLLAELGGRGERVEFLVLGVGLNVGQDEGDFPASLRGEAVSLRMLRGSRVERVAVLERFLTGLAARYDSLDDDDGASVREAWLARAPMMGHTVRVDLGEGGGFDGVATGLAPDGALVVETAAGRREVRAADVCLLRPEPRGA